MSLEEEAKLAGENGAKPKSPSRPKGSRNPAAAPSNKATAPPFSRPPHSSLTLFEDGQDFYRIIDRNVENFQSFPVDIGRLDLPFVQPGGTPQSTNQGIREPNWDVAASVNPSAPRYKPCATLIPMSAPEPERLHSWKEIATFLGCDPRTAQRYEVIRGLPVHRLPGGGVPKVFAYRSELQTWLNSNSSHSLAPAESPASATHPRLLVLLAGTTLALMTLVLILRPRALSLSPIPVRLTSSSTTKLPPLMTDGANVYYQESSSGQLGINVVSLRNGTSTPLTIALTNPDPGVIAGDGKSMLLRDMEGDRNRDQPLFLQPLPPVAPVRLGTIRAYDSAWTPDGRHIIFSSLRSVHLATKDGTVVRKLFEVPGRAYWFRWSPDGRTLRFTVYDSSRSAYSIWQTSSLDFPPAPVSFGLDTSIPQCCGTWAPDGANYFFQALIDGYFHVFAFDERRQYFPRPAAQLTSGPSSFRSPVPLPGGHRLLTLVQVQKAEVARFDLTSKRWIPLFEGVPAATVAFSPDKTQAVYTRFPDHSLWKCALPACSSPIALIPAPTRVSMPRWSPDGKAIACMVRNAAGRWHAGTVPANGSAGFTPLLDPTAEADPVWSPAGDRIAFGATPNPDAGTESVIRIIDRKTNKVETVAGSAGVHSPAWSPDGRLLAAIRADTREITLFEFSSQTWSRPLIGFQAGYLNWSRSGDRLYFLAGGPKQDQTVMAFNLGTRSAGVVASFSGLQRPVFSFGDWLGIGPDDTPLALRDHSIEDILSWEIKRR